MSYLNREQYAQLLRSIHKSRVSQTQGQPHLEAYDVRAHLNRIFGFGRWSGEVVDMQMIYETPTKTKQGKEAFSVAYRATYRLTVNAPDGTVLATYTESAVGEWTMPDFKRADAHDAAIKTAESQALKRCAINLGDQFGLSLYGKGSMMALVRKTLDGIVDLVKQDEEKKPDLQDGVPEVVPEVLPEHVEDSPEPVRQASGLRAAAQQVAQQSQPASAPVFPAGWDSMMACFQALGVTEREKQIEFMAGVVGHPVAAPSDVDADEVEAITDTLRGLYMQNQEATA